MELSIQELGSIGEFVSSIIVLVTLVYLSIQVRQSNRLTRAQARQSMMQVIQSEIYQLMEVPEAVEAMAREPESDRERAMIALWLTAALRQKEFDWMQYRDGIMDEETYRSYVDVIAQAHLSTEHARHWWTSVGSIAFNPDFVEEVNKSLEKTPCSNFFSRMLEWK